MALVIITVLYSSPWQKSTQLNSCDLFAPFLEILCLDKEFDFLYLFIFSLQLSPQFYNGKTTTHSGK